jgi:hypothetical protein
MKTVIIFALMMAACGCARVHDCRVVEIYQEEVDANDGVIQKSWRTTIESDTGQRSILSGKFAAKTGETFKVTWQSGSGWIMGE